MAGFLDAEEAFDPGDDLMGGRVSRLVEVEDAVFEILREGAFERGVAGGERGVVAGTDVEAVVVFEEDGPLGGVDGGCELLRFDHELWFVFGLVVIFGGGGSVVGFGGAAVVLLLLGLGERHGG